MKKETMGKIRINFAVIFCIVLLAMAQCVWAVAPSTIGYQGALRGLDGSLIDTTVSITFYLFPDSVGGHASWSEVHSNVVVTNGVFNALLGQTVPLSASRFRTDSLWLGVKVGGNSEMTPRLRLGSVPFSYRAGTVDDATGGTISGNVRIAGKVLVGNENLNSGEAAFVAGYRNHALDDYSMIAGGDSNQTNISSSGLPGHMVISGGCRNYTQGRFSMIGGGYRNQVYANYSTVAGGDSNYAYGSHATVGGGYRNIAASDYSIVAGGAENMAGELAMRSGQGSLDDNTGLYATVGGGFNNNALGDYSTVSGGKNNDAQGISSSIVGGSSNHATGDSSFIGGGTSNEAGRSATVGGGFSNSAEGLYAVIGGGYGNTADAYASVGGGIGNHADSTYATIPGGNNCYAGKYSFASGRRAKARLEGCFRWADSYDLDFSAPDTANSFSVRATGGIYLFTDSSLTSGVRMPARSSTWYSISDSTKKRNIRKVDTKDVLDRVVSLPIKQWSYKSQDPNIEHIGPMAQDFWNVFHIGDDSLSISTIDPAGIALAAIQELKKENNQLKNELAELRAQVQGLVAGKQKTQNMVK